jgi:hypothetical protein
MRFGMWNVRRPNRIRLLMTAAKEISKYKLHLVGVQETGWDRGSTEPAGKYTVTCIARQRHDKHLLA